GGGDELARRVCRGAAAGLADGDADAVGREPVQVDAHENVAERVGHRVVEPKGDGVEPALRDLGRDLQVRVAGRGLEAHVLRVGERLDLERVDVAGGV